MTAYHCPICGKEFYPTVSWVYRNKNTAVYYCTWSCYRKAGADKIGFDTATLKRKRVVQLDLDGKFLHIFEHAGEAACFIPRGNPDGIRRACREKISYQGYLWRYEDNEVSKV